MISDNVLDIKEHKLFKEKNKKYLQVGIGRLENPYDSS